MIAAARATTYDEAFDELTGELMDAFDDSNTGPIEINRAWEEGLARATANVEHATRTRIADAVEKLGLVASPAVIAGLIRSGRLG